MSKLQDYYRLFDMFNGNLNDEQKKVLGELEDRIIAEEILPAISESVAPVLSALRRNLTLVVDYSTEDGITVKTTRGEVVVKEHTAKKYQIPATNKTVKISEADEPQSNVENSGENSGEGDEPHDPITRAESIGFKVTFPDGAVVRGHDAKTTMIETLRKFGLQRVATFKGRIFKGYPLVGRTKRTDGRTRWQEEVDGWYVYTNLSNGVKIKVLHMVAQELGEHITIESLE